MLARVETRFLCYKTKTLKENSFVSVPPSFITNVMPEEHRHQGHQVARVRVKKHQCAKDHGTQERKCGSSLT